MVAVWSWLVWLITTQYWWLAICFYIAIGFYFAGYYFCDEDGDDLKDFGESILIGIIWLPVIGVLALKFVKEICQLVFLKLKTKYKDWRKKKQALRDGFDDNNDDARFDRLGLNDFWKVRDE